MLKNKYNYKTEEECYEDRHNHRDEWYNAIVAYNTPNAAKLGTAIFNMYDIYCGLRNKDEFYALYKNRVFDYAIWVDRSKHLPLENESSMSLTMSMADIIIDNNGTLEQLEQQVKDIVTKLEQ
jgi:hypothetical protein